jgi:Putative peptidoglycan binding domain
MAGISRLIFLLGTALSLGACTGEQVPPAVAQPMDHSNPAMVRKVQIALRNRGYYAGVVDGYLGQDTAFGIQRFQVDNGQRVQPIVDRPLLVSLGIASD